MARPIEYDFDLALSRGMNLFWKHGYSNTSLNLLETHLGIPRVSLYNKFGGKEAFFQQCLKAYSQIALEQLDTFLENQHQNGLIHWLLWMTAEIPNLNEATKSPISENDLTYNTSHRSSTVLSVEHKESPQSWGCLMVNTSLEAGVGKGLLSEYSLELVQAYRSALLDRFQRYIEHELHMTHGTESEHSAQSEYLSEYFLTFLWGTLVSIRLYGTPESLRPAVEGFVIASMNMKFRSD